MSITPGKLKEHIRLHHDSYAVLRQLEQQQRPIFLVLGHYGNWEWASLLAGLESKHPAYALYAPPSNKVVEDMLIRNRSRFGCTLVNMQQIRPLYAVLQGKPALVAFLADQTPVDIQHAYWSRFLGMNTPFHQGYDALARKFNAVVLYTSIQKKRRGQYEIHLQPISEAAAQAPENSIAEAYVRLLEKDIQTQPEYWLWSHRRWKRAGLAY